MSYNYVPLKMKILLYLRRQNMTMIRFDVAEYTNINWGKPSVVLWLVTPKVKNVYPRISELPFV